jgi:hypothetical protein
MPMICAGQEVVDANATRSLRAIDRREVSRTHPLLLLLLCVATRFAGELDAASAPSPTGCEPDGPKFTKRLTSDNIGSLKSGWATIEMHVHPGRVPRRPAPDGHEQRGGQRGD